MPQRVRHIVATLLLTVVVAGLAVPAGAAEPGAGSDQRWLAALDEAIDQVRGESPEPGVAVPRAAPTAPACADIGNDEVPQLVADVFRCRLREAGFAEPDVARITAEAVTVAQCESLFDPSAVVFDARYVDARHPSTGMFYTAAGVFQFIRKSADRWIDGGYGAVFDATANVDAAARLYIHNVRRGYAGWADWACAAANDGFKATSVLPGWPGGPAELPGWAYAH